MGAIQWMGWDRIMEVSSVPWKDAGNCLHLPRVGYVAIVMGYPSAVGFQWPDCRFSWEDMTSNGKFA